MQILICQTERSGFDLNAIAQLASQLQFFFIARAHPSEIAFGELADSILIEQSALTAHCQRQLESEAEASDLKVILTTARLATTDGDADCVVISNQAWRERGVALKLRFARAILKIGLSRILKHDSVVSSCIGAKSDHFDCLCYACECQLHELGYRDGITRLKEGFNTLNQLASGAPDSIVPGASDLLTARLRLASTYVADYQAAGISLAHVNVLVVLHFLSDLIPFVTALSELGVAFENIFLVAKPYPYSRRDEVSHVLQSLGVNVRRASKIHTIEQCVESVLDDLRQRAFGDQEKILVIEDGGYFGPALHTPKSRILLSKCVGIVEQTQKGINADKKIEAPAVPILSVAESAFKKSYESPEIGRVAIQNIARFTPNMKLSGRNALVFGFGSVGQEVAFHLNNSFNMTVSVVECENLALLRAMHRKSIVAEAQRSFALLRFKSPALIVGTTGTTSITEEVLRSIEGNAVLVSTSSDQIEIDIAALDKLADGKSVEVEEGKRVFAIQQDGLNKELVLLAEGYPINFYGSESVPNDTIDPVMTLLLVCGIELVVNPQEGVGVDERAVNRIATEKKLVERFLEYA